MTNKTFKEEVELILRYPLMDKGLDGTMYHNITEDVDLIVKFLKQKILEALPKEMEEEYMTSKEFDIGEPKWGTEFNQCLSEVKHIIEKI